MAATDMLDTLAGVLAAARAETRVAQEAEARRFALAVEWALMHPVRFDRARRDGGGDRGGAVDRRAGCAGGRGVLRRGVRARRGHVHGRGAALPRRRGRDPLPPPPALG